ncbi:MAG: hypothetical protein Q8P56_01410 [Candidatus Uhrbacteria bacterium]|nr:hypothetical protein [Candidatus Uhrbacteria bacterium]
MRKDKEKATELRKEGKTYLQISRELGVPKGTLSDWFQGLEWSEETRQKNISTATTKAREHMTHMNLLRAKKLTLHYEEARGEARREFLQFHSDPLFVAALMLYAGEGDKLLKNQVRIANTDFFVLRIFAYFLTKYCAVPPKKVRVWVLGYPDLRMEECEEKWSKELNVPMDQFYKSQVIRGKHKTRKLHYGVGNLIISDTRLKAKIMQWIELLSNKIVKDAGMVQW